MIEMPDDPVDVTAATNALVEQIIERRGAFDWNDFRPDIKCLLTRCRPTHAERIRLLTIYDAMANRVELRCAGDPEGLARIGFERSWDMLRFAFADAGAPGPSFDPKSFAAFFTRELAAGRIRRDEYFHRMIHDFIKAVEPPEAPMASRRARRS